MKRLLRIFVIETAVLYIASVIASGIVFENGFSTLFVAGIGMTIATLIVRPIINLLLLPLNLITFNLFKWVSSAVTLYLVTLLISGFRIERFAFPGLTSDYLDLPRLEVSGALSFIAFALLISSMGGLIYWLMGHK